MDIDTTNLLIDSSANRSSLAVKNIRTVLKVHYPKTTFKVKKEHDNVIYVSWSIFPMREDVEKLIAPFNNSISDELTGRDGKSTSFTDMFGGTNFLLGRQGLTDEIYREAIEEMTKEFPVWSDGVKECQVTWENYKNLIFQLNVGFYQKLGEFVRCVVSR